MNKLDKMFGENPLPRINKICDDLIAFARTAGVTFVNKKI